MNPTKKILVGLVAGAAAYGLTGCGMFGPSLEDRAVEASETISAHFAKQQDAVADIEAQMTDVQAKIDAAEAKAQPVEDAYMGDNPTPEMRALLANQEALYEAAEAADDEWYSADLDISFEEDDRLAEASEKAWDAYYAAGDEVSVLEEQYDAAYEISFEQLQKDLEPLNQEMERLTGVMSGAYDNQDVALSFPVEAECPEGVLDFTDPAATKTALDGVDITEKCVTALETWATAVS